MGTVTRSHSMFRVPEVISVRADEIIPGDLIVHRRPSVADRVFRVEDLTDLPPPPPPPGGVRMALTDFHSASGRVHPYLVKADAPVLIATREGAG